MKKLIILYVLFLSLTSCEQPVKYVDKIVVEKERVLVDNVITVKTVSYETKEVYIMTKEEIKIDPIKEYDNYVTLDKGYGYRVFGVTKEGLEEIPGIKSLFKIGKTVYFKANKEIDGVTEEILLSQTDNVVTEIEPADYPDVPPSEYITFVNGKWKIEPSKYKDLDISSVYKGTVRDAYRQVDNACMMGTSLLFSVSINYPRKESGIYVWTERAGGTLHLYKEGRLW